MDHSPELNEIAAALSKAQGSMKGALKDSANPHFKNKYADLASVWDAAREALSANGLSVVQAPGPCADGQMAMTTMLLHASGQWTRETLTIPLSKPDAQSYGSAVTYARRYALAAFVGVAPEDDDGNAASQARPAAANAPVQAAPTLAERAAKFEGAVRTATTANELEAIKRRAGPMLSDLDRADPERLVEIEAGYAARLNDLADQRVAA